MSVNGFTVKLQTHTDSQRDAGVSSLISKYQSRVFHSTKLHILGFVEVLKVLNENFLPLVCFCVWNCLIKLAFSNCADVCRYKQCYVSKKGNICNKSSFVCSLSFLCRLGGCHFVNFTLVTGLFLWHLKGPLPLLACGRRPAWHGAFASCRTQSGIISFRHFLCIKTLLLHHQLFTPWEQKHASCHSEICHSYFENVISFFFFSSTIHYLSGRCVILQ